MFTLEVLTALAAGRLSISAAAHQFDLAEREAAREEAERVQRIRRAERVAAERVAIAAAALPASAIRPRPTPRRVSDQHVITAYRGSIVSKAQTSAMNCYVIELG